jgi:hypothetical protein
MTDKVQKLIKVLEDEINDCAYPERIQSELELMLYELDLRAKRNSRNFAGQLYATLKYYLDKNEKKH